MRNRLSVFLLVASLVCGGFIAGQTIPELPLTLLSAVAGFTLACVIGWIAVEW